MMTISTRGADVDADDMIRAVFRGQPAMPIGDSPQVRGASCSSYPSSGRLQTGAVEVVLPITVVIVSSRCIL